MDAPRLVRREGRGTERTRRGFDVDLRPDQVTGLIRLAIALSDGEAVVELTPATLRSLIELAEEAERALAGDERAPGA